MCNYSFKAFLFFILKNACRFFLFFFLKFYRTPRKQVAITHKAVWQEHAE